MLSCASLERPGNWRALGAGALIVIIVLPALPLMWHAVATTGATTVSSWAHFGDALWNSAKVAGLVTAISFAVGLPAGLLSALYEFTGRRILLALATLPLLVPSFLLAIGWLSLAARIDAIATVPTSGTGGCALVFSVAAVPIVLFASYAACAGLSGSQVDAARLAGGERTVFAYAAGHAAMPALVVAALGGVLTLSDPGPGQILGLRTAASEILTSFSALYDFALAGRQCAFLTAFVVMLSAPLAWFAAPRLASEIMARQVRGSQRLQHPAIANGATAALTLLVLIGTILPLVGLTLPLLDVAVRSDVHGVTRAAAQNGHLPLIFLGAVSTVARTAGNTILYAAGAATVSAVLGLALAFCVGRDDRLRTSCLGMCFALLSLPPACAALGIVQIATGGPAWADPMLRSRLTVCVALGLRFFPVAAALGLRAWGSMSPSWAFAAATHGVPVPTYLRRVVLPTVAPVCAVGGLLVALLATADVSTVLILHPPGQASLPLAIFTVMANAPESVVAALSLVYVAAAGVLITVGWAAAVRVQS